MSRMDTGVAFCDAHDNFFRLGAGCSYCSMDAELEEHMAPTLTPEAQAVLEAAVAWYELTNQPDMHTRADTLWQSVRAYRATLPPKDYAPGELKPGTRFRFVLGGCEGTIMRMAHTEWLYWADDSGFLHKLADNTRLIPLPDQDA